MNLFTFAPSPFKLDNGETVYLRRLSAADRVEWLTAIDAKAQEAGDKASSLAVALDDSCRLLAKTLCDEGGALLFDSPDAIRNIDALTVDKLTSEVLRVNGMSSEAKEAIEKN